MLCFNNFRKIDITLPSISPDSTQQRRYYSSVWFLIFNPYCTIHMVEAQGKTETERLFSRLKKAKAAVNTVLQVVCQLSLHEVGEHEIGSGSIASTILSAAKW